MNLRFDVTVEDSVAVHVLDGFQQLEHILLYSSFGQVVLAAFDCLIQVHFHDLENQSQSSGRFIIEHLNELDDVTVG